MALRFARAILNIRQSPRAVGY